MALLKADNGFEAGSPWNIPGLFRVYLHSKLNCYYINGLNFFPPYLVMVLLLIIKNEKDFEKKDVFPKFCMKFLVIRLAHSDMGIPPTPSYVHNKSAELVRVPAMRMRTVKCTCTRGRNLT